MEETKIVLGVPDDESKAVQAMFKELQEEEEKTTATTLEDVTALATRQKELQVEKATLEGKLELVKQELTSVSQNALPALMRRIGLGSFKLTGGEEITITDGISVTYDAENWKEVEKYIISQGGQELLKTSFVCDKLTDDQIMDVAEAFGTLGVRSSVESKIHSKTLTAFIKKEVLGLDLPEEEREGKSTLEDIPSCLKVYVFSQTRLK